MDKDELQVAIECMREDGYTDKEIEDEFGVSLVKKVRKRRSSNKPRILTDEQKDKMHRGKVAKQSSARSEKIQEILSEAKSCHCGFTEETTDSEIRAIASDSCTMPNFVCPVADRMLRLVYKKFSMATT